MTPITRIQLDALIAESASARVLATEETARSEFEAWLGHYLGVGEVGVIYPTISLHDGTQSYADCEAEVLGLPLHETQWLRLEKTSTEEGSLLSAVLWTADDGLSESDSEASTGKLVLCLADLAGNLR